LFDLTTDQRKLTAFLWAHFLEHGSWPSKQSVVIWADDHGMDIKISSWAGHLVYIREEGNSVPVVRPRFDAIVGLEGEIRPLLEPLAAVARLTAQSFIQKPYFNDAGERPQIDAPELTALWPNQEEGQKVLELLGNEHLPFIGNAERVGSREYFQPTLENLRYEKVSSLDELLEVRSERGGNRVEQYPTGRHLAFLELVFQRLVQRQDWPTCVTFAVENRGIGFVPQLMQDLSPNFVRGDFGRLQRDQICLKPRSLLFVDRSGHYQQVVLRVASLFRERYRTRPTEAITVPELAATLSLTAADVVVAFRLLEHEPWHSSDLSRTPETWTLRPSEEALANRAERTASFEAYFAYWHGGGRDQERASRERVVGTLLSSEPTEEREDLSITSLIGGLEKIRGSLKDEKLARLVARDSDELQGVVTAHAWKSVLLLAGSMTELVLLDFLNRNAGLAQSHLSGKKTWPRDVGLQELINIAKAEGLLQPLVVESARHLKEYRDLIHPFKAAYATLRADRATAKTILHLLELVLEDLRSAIDTGAVTRYEVK